MNTKTIWTDPARMGGKPCIRNTRFTVAQLLAELADGYNIKEISTNFNIDKSALEDTLHEISQIYDIIQTTTTL